MAFRPLRQNAGGMHGLAELATYLKRKGAEVEGNLDLEASRVSLQMKLDYESRSVGLKSTSQ